MTPRPEGPPADALVDLHGVRRPGAHRFETEQVVAAGIEETFAFFADAANLDAITPLSLRFKIVTPRPIEMREGTLIEYRLSLKGIFAYRREVIARVLG